MRRRTFVTPPSAYLRQPLVRQMSVAHSCAAGTGRSRPPGPREPRARYEPPGVMCGVPAAARWPLQNGQARVPVRAAVVPVQLPSGSACGELPASVNGPQTASRTGGQARCPVRFPESAASIASPAPSPRADDESRTSVEHAVNTTCARRQRDRNAPTVVGQLEPPALESDGPQKRRNG